MTAGGPVPCALATGVTHSTEPQPGLGDAVAALVELTVRLVPMGAGLARSFELTLCSPSLELRAMGHDAP